MKGDYFPLFAVEFIGMGYSSICHETFSHHSSI